MTEPKPKRRRHDPDIQRAGEYRGLIQEILALPVDG